MEAAAASVLYRSGRSCATAANETEKIARKSFFCPSSFSSLAKSHNDVYMYLGEDLARGIEMRVQNERRCIIFDDEIPGVAYIVAKFSPVNQMQVGLVVL